MTYSKFKDDIRIYSGEGMTYELFRIQGEGMIDEWGTFDIIDTPTNVCVGKLKRRAMSLISKHEYLILNPTGQQIGRVAESEGRGMARKLLRVLLPEHMFVEFDGKEVAEVKRKMSPAKAVWEVDCTRVPPQFDRRTLLGCLVVMGMVEVPWGRFGQP